MEHFTKIKEKIAIGNTKEAIKELNDLINKNPNDANLYYLKGNAYRKENDWKNAMECYLEAKNIDAESPAAQTLTMMTDILNFYNKDIYNQ